MVAGPEFSHDILPIPSPPDRLKQARLTFANLRRAVEAAGGRLADVTQVLIYMLGVADTKAIDAVYREFFVAPYPNRSSAAVAGLLVPGMKMEIVAYAAVSSK